MGDGQKIDLTVIANVPYLLDPADIGEVMALPTRSEDEERTKAEGTAETHCKSVCCLSESTASANSGCVSSPISSTLGFIITS